MDRQKRILIVRPDRLGDVILSTPLPREIKKKYPDAFVAVLVRKYTKAVYENNPHVDLILCDDFDEETRKESFWERVSELRKLQFTDGLMLLPTERLNWMMFWAGIPNRIGVGNKLYQTLSFTKSVSRNKYNPLRHEADYCMDLARKIGVETFNISTEIHFSDEELIEIERLKGLYKPNGEFLIGVHSTFGFSTPNVKPEVYREVLDELVTWDNVKVAVTDYEIPPVIDKVPDVLYLSRAARDFFMDVATFDLVLSSSTGPSHVASAVKTPTLTLFCPLPACGPMLWSPMGNDATYLMPDKDYCDNKCPGAEACWYEGEGGINTVKILKSIKARISLKETDSVL